MVKKIIACADIHIRNLRRQEEYKEVLSNFIEDCIFEVGASPEEYRIVVAGDLLHNKLDISGEGYAMASWFLHRLDDIAPTIVIAGNHDINMSNLNRLDPLSTIFSLTKFKQTYYLDKDLGYESDFIKDDNIVWCLYSSFDNFAKPNIEHARITYPDCKFVGLYHGIVRSAKTDTGYQSDTGIEPSYFGDIDFGILGHIHKRQMIKHEGVQLVYCGSLIQQDFGENVSSHGYVIWDVEEEKFIEKDVKNPNYGFYTLTIDNEDDIENDKEKILNL